MTVGSAASSRASLTEAFSLVRLSLKADVHLSEILRCGKLTALNFVCRRLQVVCRYAIRRGDDRLDPNRSPIVDNAENHDHADRLQGHSPREIQTRANVDAFKALPPKYVHTDHGHHR